MAKIVQIIESHINQTTKAHYRKVVSNIELRDDETVESFIEHFGVKPIRSRDDNDDILSVYFAEELETQSFLRPVVAYAVFFEQGKYYLETHLLDHTVANENFAIVYSELNGGKAFKENDGNGDKTVLIIGEPCAGDYWTVDPDFAIKANEVLAHQQS